ncbi:MAG: CoA-binding protein [Gammaproteobacteria bacterium]
MEFDAALVRGVLRRVKAVAVVGLSPSWHRPSFFAAKYMQAHGYRIIPVNPAADEILGEKCYASVPDAVAAGLHIDAVDCFRRAEETPQLAKQAAEAGAKVLWLQLGLHNEQAQAIAEQAGMTYIADRCMKIEHGRFFGGLHWAGVNTGVISPKRGGG